MNAKLEQAIDKVAKLPDSEQEKFAAIIEEELLDEARWQESFARSGPELKRLAEEAQEDYRAGRTEPLDPDNL